MKHQGFVKYASVCILVLAFSCCYTSVYFIQYSVIGINTLSLTVTTLSTLSAFFISAFLAYHCKVRLLYLYGLFSLLLLVRYFIIPEAIGSGAISMQIIMGTLFGLCPMIAGAASTFDTVKFSKRIILLGFAGAALILLFFNIYTTIDYAILQEGCLIGFAVLIGLFILMNYKNRIPTNPVKKIVRNWTPKTRMIGLFNLKGLALPVMIGSMLLFFCFGVFEAHSLIGGFSLKNSNAAMMSVFVISLLLLLISFTKKLNTWLNGFFAIFCISYIILIFSALMMGEVPQFIFIIMGVGVLILHISIWLHLAEATVIRTISPIFLFGTILGTAMIVHRLGWLLAMALTSLLHDDNSLVAKLAAVALTILAIAFAAFLILMFKKRNGLDPSTFIQNDAPFEQSEAFKEFCSKHKVTPREGEIIERYYQGRSTPYISGELYISETTVKTHIRHVYTKLGVHNKQELLDTINAALHEKKSFDKNLDSDSNS